MNIGELSADHPVFWLACLHVNEPLNEAMEADHYQPGMRSDWFVHRRSLSGVSSLP